MNNISDKEQDCIEKAHQAKLASAKARLAEMKKNEIPFDSPIRGLASGIYLRESISGQVKQVAILINTRQPYPVFL